MEWDPKADHILGSGTPKAVYGWMGGGHAGPALPVGDAPIRSSGGALGALGRERELLGEPTRAQGRRLAMTDDLDDAACLDQGQLV